MRTRRRGAAAVPGVAVLAGLVGAWRACGKSQPTSCSAAQRQYNTAYSRQETCRSSPGQRLSAADSPHGGCAGRAVGAAARRALGGLCHLSGHQQQRPELRAGIGITRNAVDAVRAFSRQARKDGCTSIRIHAPT